MERYVGSKTPLRLIDLELFHEYQRDRREEISPTMKKPVSARSVNYELWLLRGVMKYGNCWKGDLAENYEPLSGKRSRVGKVATKDQLAKIIATAKGNEHWKVAMYCAAVAAGTGCRGGEIRNLQLKDIQMARGKILIRGEIAKNRQEREPRLMGLAIDGVCRNSCTAPANSERVSPRTISCL